MEPSGIKLEVTDWLPVPPDMPDVTINAAEYFGARLELDEYDKLNKLMEGDWSLVNDKGTLSTRMNNGWHKVGGCSVPMHILHVLRMYMNVVPVYPDEYRLTDRLDWMKGDFGDPNSCFWTDYKWQRAALVSMGAYALQTRTEAKAKEGRGRGSGRMWLVPFHGAVVATNAYGTKAKLHEHILSKHFNEPVRSVQLSPYNTWEPQIQLRVNRSQTWYANSDAVMFGTPSQRERDILDACRCTSRFAASGIYYNENAAVCLKCPFGEKGK